MQISARDSYPEFFKFPVNSRKRAINLIFFSHLKKFYWIFANSILCILITLASPQTLRQVIKTNLHVANKHQVLNISSHQGNESLKTTEPPKWMGKKSLSFLSVTEDMEQPEFSHTMVGTVHCYSLFGMLSLSLNIGFLITQQFCF